MNRILVIYHKSDFDGLCSCAIARRHFGDRAEYLGYEYGEPVPDALDQYEHVFLIDISLPKEVMIAHASRLVWIDHHISKMRELEGVEIYGLRIDGVAACRLAWQWFNHMKADGSLPTKDDFVDRRVIEPCAVQLLGEYDIWDKRNPNVDPFQLGLLAEKVPDWELMLRGSFSSGEYVEQVIANGETIQRFTEVTNAQISTERGFDVSFEGLTFRALNIARCNSMTFLAALKPEHDGCLAYFWNGRKWRFSLYHAPGKEHHDLSQIAAKFGGGGHRGACGFELDRLPVELGGVPAWSYSASEATAG